MQNAADLLEELSEKTWDRIRHSLECGISQGEETISDFNLLEIKMSGNPAIRRVEKCSKGEERNRGVDWEWIIGANNFGWIKYAVQAKKLSLDPSDTTKGTYKKLNHSYHDGSGETQIEVLSRFAKRNRMVPLYCFYNHIQKPSFKPFWNCKLPLRDKQLGCTVTPLSIAQKAIDKRGGKTFDYLHYHEETIPWRCLVKCPSILDIYKRNHEKQRGEGFRNSDTMDYENEVLGVVPVHNDVLDTIVTSFDTDLEVGVKRLLIADIGEILRSS